MLVMWLCFDKPNSVELRMKTRPAHLEWIEKTNMKFVFAGPILTDDGQTLVGSVIIADHESLEAARALQKEDPYQKEGLFERVIVQPSRQMFPKV